jgi:hypothetical protein
MTGSYSQKKMISRKKGLYKEPFGLYKGAGLTELPLVVLLRCGLLLCDSRMAVQRNMTGRV